MLDGILKKLFGDKNQKDLNELLPIVDSTNEAFEKIQDISDDDLRKKTQDFKDVINNACKDFKNQVQDLKEQAKSDQLNISEKEVLYEKIESIEKKENEVIEETLLEIMPSAFAVVKETSRRLAENGCLKVKANDNDINLSKKIRRSFN